MREILSNSVPDGERDATRGSDPQAMPFQVLGPYRLVDELGAGGMGRVYRARDARLNRDVAIKVLPDGFRIDPTRVARFRREAQVLAALNHPNIGSIYGFEESGAVLALVLELVEGQTLADRIAQGPLPLREAVGIAKQIAEALGAAHERGIVHRDLKPANVKLTPEGHVKVLDFGLAKAVGDETIGSLAAEPTTTMAGTRAGIILGTAAYMSPEQARGKQVDKRADIWAFGCTAYEMLTGRAPFAGDTLSDVIAAILDREPDWARLSRAAPSGIVHLVQKCLEKDPRRRLRDLGDAAIDLDDTLSGSGESAAPAMPPRVSRRTAIVALGSAAVGAAAGGALVGIMRRAAGSHRVTRFAIEMAAGELHVASFIDRIAISPDGAYVAFNTLTPRGTTNLYTRRVSDLESRRVADAVGGRAAFFSPDSRWLGFFRWANIDTEPFDFIAGATAIRKVPVSGGSPVTVCAAGGFSGATWAEDDHIFFVSENPGGMLRVSAAGGQPEEVVGIDVARGERTLRFPYALPGGNAVLFSVATADSESFDAARIAAVSTQTGRRDVLLEGGCHARYSPSGHLVYARNGGLFAVPFDRERVKVTGPATTVLEGVLMSRNTGAAHFDISRSGDLVYIPGRAEGGARTLVWVDRSGRPDAIPLPPRSYLHPRLSPDGRTLAVEIEGAHHDIYTYDFTSGVLSTVTRDGMSHWPVWSADGRRIGYRLGPLGRFQAWEVAADRSGPPQRLSAPGTSLSIESYSPDGRALAFTAGGLGMVSKIVLLPLHGADRTPRVLDDTKLAQGSPKFSPDGRWIAYCSSDSGDPQVYVRSVPDAAPRIQISTGGGTDPVWRRDGRELFYRDSDRMMAVSVSNGSTFTASRPHELWKGHYSHGTLSSCGPPGTTSSNYDVTPDGTRFLMIKDDDQDAATSNRIVVVLGWAADLARG